MWKLVLSAEDSKSSCCFLSAYLPRSCLLQAAWAHHSANPHLELPACQVLRKEPQEEVMVPFSKIQEIIFTSLACMAYFRHQSERLILLFKLEFGHFKLGNPSYNWFCRTFHILMNLDNRKFTT